MSMPVPELTPIAPEKSAPSAGPLHALTPREREVLGLMARGWSNTAIDRHLVIAPKTTERHITRIYQKLGLNDSPDSHRRVQAVLLWRQQQLRERSGARRRGA